MDDKNCNGSATPRLHGLRGRGGLNRTQRHEKTPNNNEKHSKKHSNYGVGVINNLITVYDYPAGLNLRDNS